jgi:hypothetical protein
MEYLKEGDKVSEETKKPYWLWYFVGTNEFIGILIGLTFLSILLLLLWNMPDILDAMKGQPVVE